MADGIATVKVTTPGGETMKDFPIPATAGNAKVGGKVSRTCQEPGTSDFVKVEVWAEIPTPVEEKNPALKKLMGEMSEACEAFMSSALNRRN